MMWGPDLAWGRRIRGHEFRILLMCNRFLKPLVYRFGLGCLELLFETCHVRCYIDNWFGF